MYLFEISSNYYQKHSHEDVERILPFFLLDFNAPKIEAHPLFCRKTVMDDDENKLLNEKETGSKTMKKHEAVSQPWTTLVAVRCPNYQWFANVYHVLPMITHEMSHNFRYLPRKERNEFVFDYIITHLSRYLMEQLLEESGIACRKMPYGSRERFFQGHIKDVIKEELKEYINRYAERIRLRDLGAHLRMEFLRATGLREILYQNNQTGDLLYKEMLQLFYLTKMSYMSPEDIVDDYWKADKLKGCELCFNILLDLLQSPKDSARYKKWTDAIGKLDSSGLCEENIYILKGIKDILKSYKTGGIPVKYLLSLPSLLIKIWVKNDEQLQKMEKSDEKIKNILVALGEGKILTAQGLLNEPVSNYEIEKKGGVKDSEKEYSNIRVDPRTDYYEKLNGFAYSYANIRMHIMTKNLKYIFTIAQENPVKDFAQKLHEEMHKEYKEMLRHRYTHVNQWITFKENQKLLTSLGVINEAPDQFTENYIQMLRGISESNIRMIICDQIQNYEEIFADYGMCKAFSFTAYGYFMYCIHIFMKERDVPENGLKNLTADRIRSLLLSLYREEVEEGKYEKELQSYWDDLRKVLISHKEELSEGYNTLCSINSFRDFTQKNFDEFMELYESQASQKKSKAENQRRLDRELYKQVWILRWAAFLYKSLQLDAELKNTDDELITELYGHIRYVDKAVDPNGQDDLELWIKKCQMDKNLQDIGSYFNDYKCSAVMEDIENGRCLKHQNQFVFDYYRKIFDCIQNVKIQMDQSDGNSKEIIDFLFDDHNNFLSEIRLRKFLFE